ncbi:MAG: dihydroorotate dehydrogenase [bacterium]|nr:dihydroorotate dehydrogenase [bacterium]
MGLKQTAVNLAGIKMKNPVMTASGTFGYGLEYADLIDLDKLGAIVTKTITPEPRCGNQQPRIFELPYGLINTIGLQNVGLERLLSEKLPALRKITRTPVIASIGGYTTADYVKSVKGLAGSGVAGIELNISCPNVKTGYKLKKTNYLTISQNPGKTYRLVREVKKNTRLPLIVKLSPNVTDITEIAASAEKAGADALCLINTFPAMAYAGSGKDKYSVPIFGGLSGPCIKPLALRMVHQVCRTVKIPVVAMGGIMNGEDARDFLQAGAVAVAVGTGNFVDPGIIIDIINALQDTDGLPPRHKDTKKKGIS